MPYKNREKAREASKERMRRYRGREGVTGVTAGCNKGVTDRLKATGLTLEGNKIVGVTKGAKPPLAIPLYNPAIHKPGDRVRMFDGNKMIETVVPDLDADGSPIPGQAMGQSYSLVGNKLFTPAFTPAVKPLPKVKTGRRKW